MKSSMDLPKKKVLRFVVLAFGLAWVMQGIGIAHQNSRSIFQMCLAVSMLAPLAATLLSGISLKGLGWRPHLRKKLGWLAFAWWMPGILALVGGGLYFAIFPSHFSADVTEAIQAMAGTAAVEQLKEAGMTPQMYGIITILQALTLAPIMNTFLALGEEAGWRGVLYPYLKAQHGRVKGRVLGGMIWGVWHWPIIAMAGYEYGKGYIGAPFSGMLLFCLVTICLGALLDMVYEKTDCIWLSSLMHGAFNASTFMILFVKGGTMASPLLGPMTIGLIGGLPMMVLAVWCLRKGAAARSL